MQVLSAARRTKFEHVNVHQQAEFTLVRYFHGIVITNVLYHSQITWRILCDSLQGAEKLKTARELGECYPARPHSSEDFQADRMSHHEFYSSSVPYGFGFGHLGWFRDITDILRASMRRAPDMEVARTVRHGAATMWNPQANDFHPEGDSRQMRGEVLPPPNDYDGNLKRGVGSFMAEHGWTIMLVLFIWYMVGKWIKRQWRKWKK